VEITAQSLGKTWASEFFQLKGDLLLALSRDNVAEAESWFQNAVSIAAEVQAPMLQLRAALRLSRLWREEGKTEQARKLLSDAYERFTEGFTTADLSEAKALLDDLV
jgi:predicted ATPase